MKNKSNLDEMQELKLLKIEHRGCWLAFWGLVAAIMIQRIQDGGSGEKSLGETCVLLVLSVYLLGACYKNGIWDRKLKPNGKTNFLLSLIAGAVCGLVWFVISYRNYHALLGSIATFVFMLIVTTTFIFLLLTASAQMFVKRKQKLDRQVDQEEE